MFRRASPSLFGAVAALLAAPSWAQPVASDGIGDDSPAGVLEAYLRARGLSDLLAEHLRHRLAESTGTPRVEIAERLGRVYAELLEQADSQAERDELTALSAALLEQVPAADTFDLRIALIKSRYLLAEEVAERSRLRLASDEERREATATLDATAVQLSLLGERADRRVEALERRERSGGVVDLPELRGDLAQARRERSLAKYYSGWSLYYTALLTGSPAPAEKALTEFGYLLGAEGGLPTLDRLPKSLLRYEHVARAAMAVALCHALRGEPVAATMWIDEIRKSEDLHPGVLDQIFSRQVTVLATGRRWDALSRAVEQRRGARLGERATDPLRTSEARLLAVEVLEALRAPDSDAARREAAEPIAGAAMGDLLARGESAQVIDLVERYGTLPIGSDGFIGRYVAGLRAYRLARTAHADSGLPDTLPTREPGLVSAYLTASDLLRHAFESPDAGSFGQERAAAGIMLGLSLYYKDSPAEAAERFEQTARLVEPGTQQAEALWMAVVSLERALEQGRVEVKTRLHAAALLFVQNHPRDERAARLLLRFAGDGLFDNESALAVLLAVDRGSPLRPAAQRRAADLLYRAYAGSGEPERSELAGRFLPVAFDCLDDDLGRLRDPAARAGDEDLTESVLLRARQALDAALTPLATDTDSARRAFAAIDEVRARAGAASPGLSELGGELAYRRLQLALATGDEQGRERAHAELESIGGRFLDAADRFLFSRAVERWRRTREVGDARRVTAIGVRLLGEGVPDRAHLSIAETTAEAATAVWEAQADRGLLNAAISIDRRVRSGHAPTAALLRRLGRNAESAGDRELAYDAWATLTRSLPEGERDWFEAKHETLRVLAELRPDEARAALDQHKVLYPMLGPPPWGDRFAALEVRLRAGGRAEP